MDKKAKNSTSTNKTVKEKANEAPEAVQTEETEVIEAVVEEPTNEASDAVAAKLSDMEKRMNDAVSTCQRLQAEFDNFRKRNAKLRTESLADGQIEVITALLGVLDSMERAAAFSDQADEKSKELISGLQKIQKQFIDALAKFGLESVKEDGAFNPNYHEAVMQEEVEGALSGNITAVLQKGYMVHDRVIRHSLVKVAK